MVATLPIPAEAPPGEIAPGALIGGKYRVVRTLGSGATGAVYEVHDAVLPERRLALKILHNPAASATELESQRDELRSMVQVRHPSIIALYDHGVHEGRLFSVLPLMRGEPLEGRVFSRREVHRIGVMLAEAVAAMHAVGLTHQDIKPENVRLTQFDGVPEMTPILLDLGTAVRVGAPLRGFSPAFLAPEIASALVEGRGAPVADPKADVYSLAATLRAMLELEQDEVGDELVIFLVHRAEGTVPRFRSSALRFLDPSFARFMAKDPNARPSAKELAKELDVLLRPERRRRRALRASAALLGIAAIVGVAAYEVVAADRDARAARAEARAVDVARRDAVARATAALGELGSTRDRLQSASNRVDELAADAARLAAESQKTREEAESADARAHRLEKTVAAMTSVIADLRNAVTAERQLRDRYAEQVREREAQLADVTSREQQASAARDQATSEVDQLTRRVATLQTALDRSANDLAAARNELQQTEAERSAEADQASQRLAALQANVTDLEHLLDACRSALPPSPAPEPTPP